MHALLCIGLTRLGHKVTQSYDMDENAFLGICTLVSCSMAIQRQNTRTPVLHRGPHQWGVTRPEDADVAIQA